MHTAISTDLMLLPPACAVQVEHPVTEGITDVNVPAAQLMIGMGIPLWRMPGVRGLFGKDREVRAWRS